MTLQFSESLSCVSLFDPAGPASFPKASLALQLLHSILGHSILSTGAPLSLQLGHSILSTGAPLSFDQIKESISVLIRSGSPDVFLDSCCSHSVSHLPV